MKKVRYITLGEFNKKYFLILGSIIVKFIVTFINGFTPSLTLNTTYFIFGYKPFFIFHPILTMCFQYFAICLGGLIIKIIYNKKDKDSTVKDSSDDKTSDSANTYEYSIQGILEGQENEQNEKIKKNEKKNVWRIFLIFSVHYFAQFISDSLDRLGVGELDFWPLEFIFLFIFAKIILHKTTYIHQKIPLILLIFICTIVYLFNSFIRTADLDCSKVPADEVKNCQILNNNIYQDISRRISWYILPIIITLYLAAMCGNAYSAISYKWLSDIKYMNVIHMLIFIGLIGFTFSLLMFLIVSNIACSKNSDLLENICRLEKDGELFYDNYHKFRETKINSSFYIDIFITLILFLIACFLNKLFELLIITNLDPFYLIPINSVYHFIYEIIDYSITYPITNKYRNEKFICILISNSLSVILCSIHLEIIELHFCGCDIFLRKNIIKREIQDKNGILMQAYNEERDEATV